MAVSDWIPVELENTRHVRNEHRSLSIVATNRSTISSVNAENFWRTRGRASTPQISAMMSCETYNSIASDSTGRRHAPEALAPGTALKKHHAVEYAGDHDQRSSAGRGRRAR